METKDKVVKILMLFVFIFVLGLLIPYTIILSKAGLSNTDTGNQLDFYVKILVGFGLALLILVFINIIWKRNDQYGDSIGFMSLGESPSIPFFKRFTAPQLTIYSFIIFSIVLLIANLLKSFGSGFFGLIVLPQQFTPLDSLAVSTLLTTTGENVLAMFAQGFILLLLTIFALKYKLKSTDYKLLAYILVFVGLWIFGYLWHQSHYANSDVAGIVTGFSFGLGAVLTLATGLWTIFWAFHVTNNFFIDYSRLFNSDITLFTIIIIIVSLIAFSLWWYRGRLLGEKKVETIV